MHIRWMPKFSKIPQVGIEDKRKDPKIAWYIIYEGETKNNFQIKPIYAIFKEGHITTTKNVDHQQKHDWE